MTGSMPPEIDPAADKAARQHPQPNFRTVQGLEELLKPTRPEVWRLNFGDIDDRLS